MLSKAGEWNLVFGFRAFPVPVEPWWHVSISTSSGNSSRFLRNVGHTLPLLPYPVALALNGDGGVL